MVDMISRRRHKIKRDAITLLGGCCSKCGYKKCDAALEFHHTDPTKKDFAIGNAYVKSWAKIKAEVEKCILVCANCHREIHEEIYSRQASKVHAADC